MHTILNPGKSREEESQEEEDEDRKKKRKKKEEERCESRLSTNNKHTNNTTNLVETTINKIKYTKLLLFISQDQYSETIFHHRAPL